ncbi:MAG: T9SS type A sorting domain-containing protein [Saprospiraceae bacterium]|nr:T9SS type A sorting domain-containing protein [Saprospiraceae bacterium]
MIDPNNFVNPVPLKVSGKPLSLKLANKIGKPSGAVIVKNDFSFMVDIKNDSTEEFSGEVVLELYDFDGELIETINSTQPVVIPAKSALKGIEFKKNNNTLDPGTYNAAILASYDQSSNDILSNDQYDNPVTLQIIEEPLLEDKFEKNNSSTEAYVVPLNFVNDLAISSTAGSNLHNENDYDYYKINLPAGFKYAVNAEVHDEVYSPMGVEYNCDVYFSYDLGSGESDFYDDTLTQIIVLNNGGDIIFKVSPYFVGFNGTYLLNLKISRSKINSLSKESSGEMVDLFPNPASDQLYIKLMDKTSSISEIAVKNQLGESISVMAINKNEEVTVLNTALLPTGIYFLQIKSNGKSAVNKKFIINR